MILKKTNTIISTLSFILVVVGYPFFTTLFLPANSELEGISQKVTIPYRAFALLLMGLVIVINIKKPLPSFSFPLAILIAYWILITSRIFSDIYLRDDYFFTNTSQLWLYVFGICLAGLFATIKGFDYIDTEKALYWIYFALAITLIVTLFSNQNLLENTESELREDANVAINTISYGNLGVLTIILSLFLLINRKFKIVFNIFIVLIMILAIYSMLRSGSRGPILALLVVGLFWLFAKSKNFLRGSSIVFLMLLLVYLFQDFLLSVMGTIAPVIEYRIRDSLQESVADERDSLHQSAIDVFTNHPFFGNQFGIFDEAGSFAYAHNLFLDSLMALGIVGGLMMAYLVFQGVKISYHVINTNKKYFWISLIFIQQLLSLMVSGAFYQDQLFTVTLAFLFISYNKDFKK